MFNGDERNIRNSWGFPQNAYVIEIYIRHNISLITNMPRWCWEKASKLIGIYWKCLTNRDMGFATISMSWQNILDGNWEKLWKQMWIYSKWFALRHRQITAISACWQKRFNYFERNVGIKHGLTPNAHIELCTVRQHQLTGENYSMASERKFGNNCVGIVSLNSMLRNRQGTSYLRSGNV